MQQTIAEHLGLDLSTVQNFFMNARRRSRGDHSSVDDTCSAPYPYQQVELLEYFNEANRLITMYILYTYHVCMS